MKRTFYTPTSFVFSIFCFVGLLMNQNAYMVVAFIGALILTALSAGLDVYSTSQGDAEEARMEEFSQATSLRLQELNRRLDQLTSAVGLKSMR